MNELISPTTAENLSRITFLSMFMGSTSARLEPILALSFRIPEAASSLVKFIGRHLSLALAMLFAFRFSNFLSSFSLSESSRTHRCAHKQNSRSKNLTLHDRYACTCIVLCKGAVNNRAHNYNSLVANTGESSYEFSSGICVPAFSLIYSYIEVKT